MAASASQAAPAGSSQEQLGSFTFGVPADELLDFTGPGGAAATQGTLNHGEEVKSQAPLITCITISDHSEEYALVQRQPCSMRGAGRSHRACVFFAVWVLQRRCISSSRCNSGALQQQAASCG